MDYVSSRIKSVLLAILMLSATAVWAEHNQPPTTEGTPTTENHGEAAPADSVDYFGSFIFHHIGDDYMFQVFNDIYVPLPVIIFEPGKGFDMFMSNQLLHPDDHHMVRGRYTYHHGQLLVVEKDASGHVIHNEEGHPVGKHEATLGDLIAGNKNVFYNFSITKNVFAILLSCGLLLWMFLAIARKYKRNPDKAPNGLQGMMEILIVYIQNDVVKPSIGEKKYRKFLPYLLTLFFFIWINNSIGLIPIFPGGANVTGNIAVTMSLALIALFLQLINANKNFWAHIFWFPGVPVPVKILLAVIEFVGLFSKPFALMIRLFANITAGHIIIMSIIGIAFAMQQAWIGWAGATFSIAMYILEVLVALIQAYIFTLLTALMIGAAVEEPHGHGHDAAHEHAH